MDAVIIYSAVVMLIWGLCNRFWGCDDEVDGISKVLSALMLGAVTGEFTVLAGFSPWQALGAFASCAIGFWLGRLQDGVRGTFTDKALRGWRYCGIYVGMALVFSSPYMLLPSLFFWQSGVIHWLFYTHAAGRYDYVPAAELTDGLARGFLVVLPLAATALLNY